jgi:predicted lipoprotein with Yx(FWY)xxD motif
MSKSLKTAALLAAFALALPSAVSAHVAVAPTMAAPGATETLTFIVGHGCDGKPTTALRVELPKAVTAVEPQPKPGWTPAVETLPDGGRAVTWRGGEPLTKADGFSVRLHLPSQGGRVSFVAVQSCGETTVRWDEPVAADGPRPKHPAPAVTLAAAASTPSAAAPPAATARLPTGVQRLADGGLADAQGRPLYIFNFDTMVGMSHCEGDCAKMWPPLLAPKGAQPLDGWSLIRRENGDVQWALKDKPLYTYSQDRPGGPPRGLEAPNWARAK